MSNNQPTWEIRFVNSTAITLVAYNRASGTMRIIFRSMTGYDYPHTPEREFLKLANSESVGHSFQPLRSQESDRLASDVTAAFYQAAIKAQRQTRVLLE